MKRLLVSFIATLSLVLSFTFAQDDKATITPATEAGENLDLQAVLELFDHSTLKLEEDTN